MERKQRPGTLAIIDVSDPYIQDLLRPMQEDLEIRAPEEELLANELLTVYGPDELTMAWYGSEAGSLMEGA